MLGKDEIRPILEVRRALEHLAAQRAIRYASDEALARHGILWRASPQRRTTCAGGWGGLAFQHELALCGRQRHSAAHLLFVQGARYHPVAAFLPACTASARFAATRKRCTITCAGGTLDGAGAVDRRYLEQSIDGSQQIYEER